MVVDVIKREFTQSMNRVQIKRLWRTRKFGDQTRCPDYDYSPKLWDTGPDQWTCFAVNASLDCLHCSPKAVWIALNLSFRNTSIAVLVRTDAKWPWHFRTPNVDYNRVHLILITIREEIRSSEELTKSFWMLYLKPINAIWDHRFLNKYGRTGTTCKQVKVENGLGAINL